MTIKTIESSCDQQSVATELIVESETLKEYSYDTDDPTIVDDESTINREQSSSRVVLERRPSTPTTTMMMSSSMTTTTTAAPSSQQPISQLEGTTLSVMMSSDAAQIVFGESVGPCWGEFTCKHNRIPGRMYATSNAVLFYSNVLGFERRTCIEFLDIQDIELYRTTSIRLIMVNFETHVFKSFSNREEVVHLLQGLKLEVKRVEASDPATAMETNSSVSRLDQMWMPDKTCYGRTTVPVHNIETSSVVTSQSQQQQQNPSDSSVRATTSTESHSSSVQQAQSEEMAVPTGNDSPSSSSKGEEAKPLTPEEAWRLAKAPGEQPLTQIGLECVKIPCSLETYYETFLANNAPYSQERYLKEYVKDKDVEITVWEKQKDESMTRVLKFTHPIKSKIGMAPSEAPTTRYQYFRRYGNLGYSIVSKTYVVGVPTSDSFYMEDKYIIEATGKGEVSISTRFDIRFTKMNIFKSIIEKNSRKETKSSHENYITMIHDALDKKSVNAAGMVEDRSSSSRDAEDVVVLKIPLRSLYWFVGIGVTLLTLFLIVMILQLMALTQTLSLLHAQVETTRLIYLK